MVLRLKWAIVFCLIISSMVSFANAAETEPNIKFKKVNLQLKFKKNTKIIMVELAETEEQHARGLMFRTKLKNDEGMLFVFADEQIRQFWMKNTLINLDIGYFDKNKRLVDIQQMKAVTSIMQIDIPTYPSKQPAMYALEMSQGWFKKNKFEEGTIMNIVVRP